MEKKIVERKSYWENFNNKYPDASGFRSFVASDPSLIKIFNFCLDPPFWNIKKFPINEKIKELETITDNEQKYLGESYWGIADKDKQEWLGYLINLFDIVRLTVIHKQRLDLDNEQSGFIYTQDQVLDRLETLLWKYLSVDETITFIDKDGEVETRRAIGKYFPAMFLFLNEKYDKTTKGKTINLDIHLRSIAGQDMVKEKIALDICSVISMQKLRNVPGISEICFDSNPSDHATIQYYYKGKPLLERPFEFQAGKRYEPILKKGVNDVINDDDLLHAMGLLELTKGKDASNPLSKWDFLFTEARERLLKAILSYNRESGIPGSYFKACFTHFKSELFEKYSSEAGDVPCNPFCRSNKSFLMELPCQYETETGYCIDPKQKRRLKENIDRSGGGLDDFISQEGNEDERFIDENAVDAEAELIKRDEDVLKSDYLLKVRSDKRLMEIIKRIDGGVKISDLPDRDQKYFRRRPEELKKEVVNMRNRKG